MATKNVIIKDKTGTDELLPKTSAGIVTTGAIAGKDTVESALSDLNSRASANASSIASAVGRISALESSSGGQAGDLAALKGYFTDGAANKAVADADGNEISSTYAKESELGIFAKAPKITSANIDTYIADSSIDSGKIADGTIVDADVSTSANIAQSKISGLVAGLADKASLSGDNAFTGDNAFSGNATFDGTLGATIGSVRLTESGLEALESASEASAGHIANKGNPHGVTKAQVGLGNVANVLQYSDSNHPGIGDVDGRQSLIIRLNGGTAEGTSQFTYDVSQAKSVNVTPAGIGAATSAQGAKADSALQSSDIKEGKANGTISVKGTDVAVHGLGSAAYAQSADFDAAGSASSQVSSHNSSPTAHQSLFAGKADKATTVNGHALSGNVTVTKGDVGLGSVENKSMDSTPTSGSANYVTSGGVKSYVDSAVGAVKQFNYQIVESLPAASASTVGTIYLKAHAHDSTSGQPDSYDEYITISNSGSYSWETIGNTDIDLTDYATKSYVDGKTWDASDIASGTLPIARGGTGAATAAAARTSLGITPANIGAATSAQGAKADSALQPGGVGVSSTGTALSWGTSTNVATVDGKTISVKLPANPNTDTNTWRNVSVNGTQILGTATSTGDLNLKAGSNVSISNSGGDVTISSTNTTYSAGNGLTASGTTFSVGAGTGISVGADSVGLAAYGTAGSAGPSANASPSHGGTFSVPQVTVDAYGRAAVTNRTITLPGDSNTHYTTHLYATTSTGTANAATANPYLRLFDDTAARESHQIAGAGKVSVASDASGKITITGASTTLGDLGVTATAAELNYMDGVTSNVQTQLNGKAASGHTHNYAGSSTAGGSANSAAKLATPRAINGTNFDGTAAITTANWGTARTLTIGSSAKSVNGSANVSWSLSEIGAQPTLTRITEAEIDALFAE